LSPKIGPLGRRPGPGREAKITQKHLLVTFSPEKLKPQTKNFFFSMSTTRLAESAEGLNSSLAQSPGSYRIAKLCKKSDTRGTERVKICKLHNNGECA